MSRIALVSALLSGLCMSCVAPEQCSPFTSGTFTKCTDVKACCTNIQCRYTAAGGKEWKCDGTNCSSAATKLVNDCQ